MGNDKDLSQEEQRMVDEAIKRKDEIVNDILSNYEDGPQGGGGKLPSRFQYRQVVHFRLDERMPFYTATVRGICFRNSKVKYDLDVWLGQDGNTSTRLPNIDSAFVHDAFKEPTLDELAG